jgi:hypothetical protein
MPNDLNPSLAFTALLDQGRLAGLDQRAGHAMTAQLVAAYEDYLAAPERETPPMTMYRFAQTWEPADQA